MTKSRNEDLEKAFDLIKSGNLQAEKGEEWNAASSYCQACELLFVLADQQACDTPESNEIASLYRSQCQRYLDKARESLISAMKVERDQDNASNHDAEDKDFESKYKCLSISDDDAENRIRSFTFLFSKEVETASPAEQVPEEEAPANLSSIEERLMQLNKSLPQGFKTSEERMKDINRGLNRLGLSSYVDDNSRNINKITPPMSESDQVNQIIAQAQDEVQFSTTPAKVEETVDDVDVEESEVDTIPDSDDDSFLEGPWTKIKNKGSIRNKIGNAQAKLSEVLAMMNVLKDLEEEAEAELEGDDVKRASDNKQAASIPAQGKKALQEAKAEIVKALQLWTGGDDDTS